jgi:hypothetical protein
VNIDNQAAGPWTVVTKPRRQRRNAKSGVGNKEGATITGSRFAILDNNDGDDKLETNAEADSMIPGDTINKDNLLPKVIVPGKDDDVGVRVIDGSKKGSLSLQSQDKNQGHMGKSIRESKLATRGTASFKGKSGHSVKKGPENITNWMVMASIKAINENTTNEGISLGDQQISNNVEGVQLRNSGVDNNIEDSGHTPMGQTKINLPNMARPPDVPSIPPFLGQENNNNLMEGDDFVDATDQGYETVDSTDMEVVGETPNLDQQ